MERRLRLGTLMERRRPGLRLPPTLRVGDRLRIGLGFCTLVFGGVWTFTKGSTVLLGGLCGGALVGGGLCCGFGLGRGGGFGLGCGGSGCLTCGRTLVWGFFCRPVILMRGRFVTTGTGLGMGLGRACVRVFVSH